MKKVSYISLLLVSLIFTGCSKGKKIECSYYDEVMNQKMTYDYILNFDNSGNKLKTVGISLDFNFNDRQELNEFIGGNDINACTFIIEIMDFDANGLVNCESKISDNNLIVTMKYQYNKLKEEQKKNLFFDMTYSEFKKQYENNNSEEYVCVFDSDKKPNLGLNSNGLDNALDNTSKSSTETVVYRLIKAAENYVMTYMLDNYGDWSGGITFVCDGNSCTANIDGNEITLNYNGIIPTSGEIYIDDIGDVTIKESLIINGYTCSMTDSYKVECVK